MGPDRLAVMSQVPGDHRHRATLPRQCRHVHVVLLCEHRVAGSFEVLVEVRARHPASATSWLLGRPHVSCAAGRGVAVARFVTSAAAGRYLRAQTTQVGVGSYVPPTKLTPRCVARAVAGRAAPGAADRRQLPGVGADPHIAPTRTSSAASTPSAGRTWTWCSAAGDPQPVLSLAPVDRFERLEELALTDGALVRA